MDRRIIGITIAICFIIALILYFWGTRLPRVPGDELYPVSYPTYIWGPRFWFVFHTVTMAYPETPTISDQKAVTAFINAFADIIPCPRCKIHFAQILKENPLSSSILGNRAELMEWAWYVHNKANIENGQPTISKGEATARFLQLRTDSSIWHNWTVFFVGIGAGVGFMYALINKPFNIGI